MGTSTTSNYDNSAIEYSAWANTPITTTATATAAAAVTALPIPAALPTTAVLLTAAALRMRNVLPAGSYSSETKPYKQSEKRTSGGP